MILTEKSNIEKLMDRHELSDDTRNLIDRENLLPETLVARLHNSYPQHSRLQGQSKALFTSSKRKYTGLKGFREICKILKEKDIVLDNIKERELFIEVYRFMVTKHV